ncbi:MAG: DUF58 domain-containing protein [Candidatus Melainabacteria bacterium HGW-Melainabacteria-1]|nr:MAG: DUF58 domain-containing protein [Candidatus Melainabacteria bacterium HGW-Melainabacteria-1]
MTETNLHSDLWKHIRRIEITTRQTVNQLLSGQYVSVFKGLGLEFEEVRPYAEGDDERHIDWNVTARTGQVHVKRYIEERELSLFLLVDISPSVYFGSQRRLKLDLAIEFAAIMAFSALRNNDRVGLLLFDDSVRKVIPPRKGRRHALRVIRELLRALEAPPVRAQNTELDGALHFVNSILHRRGIIFVVSDFLDTGNLFPLKVLNRRHECIAVRLRDPLENQLPDAGWVRLQDPESGQQQLWNFGDRRVRERFAERAIARDAALTEQFRRMGVDQVLLETSAESVWKELIRFYQGHRR